MHFFCAKKLKKTLTLTLDIFMTKEIVVVALDQNIYVHDSTTLTELGTFKSNDSTTNGLAFVKDSFTGKNVGFYACQSKTPHVHGYAQNSSIPNKMIMSEKFTSIASSLDGFYLACGAASGKIYLYNLACGGVIANIFDAHYKSVDLLLFSYDGNYLISGSSDSVINIWNVCDILDRRNNNKTPKFSLSEHSGSITGLSLKFSRLYSCSLDKTVRIWDLNRGSCDLVVVFPSAINSLVVDDGENFIFSGCGDGKIYRFDILRHNLCDPVIPCNDNKEKTFVPHVNRNMASSSVTTMDISLDGTRLYSGHSDGSFLTWDIHSFQMLKCIKHSSLPVTTIKICRKPDFLFDSVLGKEVGKICIPFLQRLMKTEDEGVIILSMESKAPGIKIPAVEGNNNNNNGKHVSSSSTKVVVEEKILLTDNNQSNVIKALEEENERLKSLNSRIYNHYVDTFMDNIMN
jgi:pre-rRNA-processing protein IPI3